MSAVQALTLDGVSSGYGESIVVRDVALQIEAGGIFALLGKNGMGKSTLLKTIMGFLPLQGGSIQLFGETLGALPPHRIARKAIAYVPQDQALFQDLTVEENLRLALRDERVMQAGLQRIGEYFSFIPQRLKQRAGTLSGGEQKMLLVARGLMSKPRFMLIDEITEGLQPSVIDRLTRVLRDERERSGTAILIVEQNVKFALGVADQFAVLKLGEIVERGAVSESDAEARIVARLAV